MPMPRPTILASASGELNTRALPNARWSPCVTLKTPPLPETCSSADSRLQSATSSPKTTIRGSRAISSFNVRLIAATIVSGLPSGCAGVSNAAEVGSTSGEYTHSPALVLSGFGGDGGEFVVGEAVLLQDFCEAFDRIAPGFRFPFRRRLVQLLVVGERVR